MALAMAEILEARALGTVIDRYPFFGMMVNHPGIVKNICTVPPPGALARHPPRGGFRGEEPLKPPLFM